jgi:hypothetical protein
MQSFISGIGNWIADEVLYQVALFLLFVKFQFQTSNSQKPAKRNN